MNAVAGLCEKTGADIDMVRRGIGSDERIGRSFLYPGVGYGGSCFPKDVKALIRTMNDLDADPSILQAVDDLNDHQKSLLLRQVVTRLGEDLDGMTIAVWGLAFKPNTDDMREAPSLVTIEGLLERGARVVAHDPEALTEAKRRFGDRVELCEDDYEVLKGAGALVIHTEWGPYRRPDFERMKAEMAQPLVFDGRNLYEPGRMAELGFEYYSVGRAVVGGS
jgi:UDPglucose 6-dehydrogenase